MKIKVMVEKGEGGYFVAHLPSPKICRSEGRTKEEALENMREAIALYLEAEPIRLERGQEIVELEV